MSIVIERRLAALIGTRNATELLAVIPNFDWGRQAGAAANACVARRRRSTSSDWMDAAVAAT